MIAQGAETHEPAHYNSDLDSLSKYRKRQMRQDRLEDEMRRLRLLEQGVPIEERVGMSIQVVLAVFCWGE